MILKMDQISKSIKHKSSDLITRPIGEKFYKKAQKMLEFVTENEVVIIDFESIKLIDSSFVDEFIVNMVLDSRIKNYFIKLKNLNEIIEINIDSVFNTYSDLNEDRIAVSTDSLCSNKCFYIGILGKEEKEIIDYLRVNKYAEFKNLKKFIGMDDEKCRLILDNLFFLRIIRKENEDHYSII